MNQLSGEPDGCRPDPADVPYESTMLDHTIEKLGRLAFRRELDEAAHKAGCDLGFFHAEADSRRDEQGCRIEAAVQATFAVDVTLIEDDTPADYRRLLVERLRKLAGAIEEAGR